MNEPTAKSISRVREAHQLIGAEHTPGNLDPLHLHALLPLSIGAKVQPQLLHLRFINFARAVFPDLLLVVGQLFADMRRQSLQFGLPDPTS